MRLFLKYNTLVKFDILTGQTGDSGVVKKGETVQVIYGLQIGKIRKAVDQELGLEQ